MNTIEQEVHEKMNRDWMLEVKLLRFCFLDRLILVNDFGLLNAERRDVWLKWLTPKYPKHKVIMV